MPKIKNIYRDIGKKIDSLKNNRSSEKSLDKKAREKKPGDYTATSYIYIRANDMDDGVRPVAGIAWRSPDLNVIPMGATGDVLEETKIVAGKQYQIECTVRNLGDLDIPFATVDFFLVTPSLGFRVSAASPVGVMSASIRGQDSTRVVLDWVAKPEDAGHKCLFARAYSFSPMDMMDDFDALNSRIDRHIGQQNLSVILDGDSLDIQVFPFEDGANKGGRFQIEIRPTNKLEPAIMAMPFMRQLKFKQTRQAPAFQLERIQERMTNEAKLTVRKKSNASLIGWSGVLQDSNVAHFRVKSPVMGLKKNEIKAFDIVKIDTKSKLETGGIMLLVRGR